MSRPLIVSYYTVGTRYQHCADRLRASCDRLGLDHQIVGLPSRPSWEANIAAKAGVCRTAWQESGRPIAWVDADAVIHAMPDLFRSPECDFAVHKWKGKYFSSGTVFFHQTAIAGRLLDGWVRRCETDAIYADVLDQTHLEREWCALGGEDAIRTLWLPRSYYQVFDAPLVNGEAAVIEHFQASRAERRTRKMAAQ